MMSESIQSAVKDAKEMVSRNSYYKQLARSQINIIANS